jgi:hypothetical protein
MRLVRSWGCAVVLMHALAQAEDVPVSYLVEERPLRNVAAGDLLLLELFSDAGCSSLVHTQVEDAADVGLLTRLRHAKVRGAAPAPARRLRDQRRHGPEQLRQLRLRLQFDQRHALVLVGDVPDPLQLRLGELRWQCGERLRHCGICNNACFGGQTCQLGVCQ